MKFSEIQDPTMHEARFRHVDRRWKGLYDEIYDVGKLIIRYLTLVNAGGMVATLSFMGAMRSLDPMPGARLILATFSGGLVLVGFGLAFSSYRLNWLIAGWNRDTGRYFQNELDWRDVLERDEGRQKNRLYLVGHVLAWLSFICFICGLGLAGRSLFT